MKTGPAIRRTRDARQAISKNVGDDPAKMVAYYSVHVLDGSLALPNAWPVRPWVAGASPRCVGVSQTCRGEGLAPEPSTRWPARHGTERKPGEPYEYPANPVG